MRCSRWLCNICGKPAALQQVALLWVACKGFALFQRVAGVMAGSAMDGLQLAEHQGGIRGCAHCSHLATRCLATGSRP